LTAKETAVGSSVLLQISQAFEWPLKTFRFLGQFWRPKGPRPKPKHIPDRSVERAGRNDVAG
jgi:hypothetical protein